MILTDSHIHTFFSTDSDSTPESMIEGAIYSGLKRICITDHQDVFFPHPEHGSFIFEFLHYIPEMERLREKYKQKIDVCIGVEFGLRNEPGTREKTKELLCHYEQEYKLDFIIGSTHILENTDPYFPMYWEKHNTREGMEAYFKSISDNIRYYDCFDSYGHADYLVRYIPDKVKNYSPLDYRDLIDEFLKLLIEHGKALEVNSAGFKYGLGTAHPKKEILVRYKELGGELLTIGSDAHRPDHIAFDFRKTSTMIKQAGFTYYCFYKNRKPEFIKL